MPERDHPPADIAGVKANLETARTRLASAP